MDEMGFHGGRGSCLAVTAQYIGADRQWWTSDDVYEADLNAEPAFVSADFSIAEGVEDEFDRVRGFFGAHAGGAVFALADGSVHFLNEEIDRRSYIFLSHINSGEPSTLFDR